MRRAGRNCLLCLIIVGTAAPAAPQPTGAATCTEPRDVLVGASPGYTEAARRARIQGSAAVRVTLGDDGQVQDATVEKTLPMGLDVASRNAALHWVFARPAQQDPCRTLILEFHFELGPKSEGVVPLGRVAPPISIKIVGVVPGIATSGGLQIRPPANKHQAH